MAETSLKSVARLAWTVLWWLVALAALWQLAGVVL